MALSRAWLLALFVTPALAAQDDGAAVAHVAIDAPALFATNCAKCHGLDGSGTGPAVLDRPARNFKEGGFSFGNTPETIARTLAHGIPGSPMPAFEGALSEAQLRALADFVITLGPPVKEVSEAETLLHVTDRALVVRGILPALTEGGPVIPRGLLIGTTDGLTFEYAADDVRLLAVRLGDFVKRADWGDRGGSPLEPLGKVVWSHDSKGGPWSAVLDAASPPGFTSGETLIARLLSTSSTPSAELVYVIGPPDAAVSPTVPRALVTERPGAAMLRGHAGFSRHIRVSRVGSGSGDGSTIVFRFGGWSDGLGAARDFVLEPGYGSRTQAWMRLVAPDTGEVLRISYPVPVRRELGITIQSLPSGLNGIVQLERSTRESVMFYVEHFVISPWTPEVIAELRKELNP